MPEDRAIVIETSPARSSPSPSYRLRRGQPRLRLHRRADRHRPGRRGRRGCSAGRWRSRPRSGDPKRWFHGLVSEFRLVKVEERLAHYEAVLRPWLWLLGLTHDCRVFQNLSVVEIIEEIFGKYPEAQVREAAAARATRRASTASSSTRATSTSCSG